MNGVSRQKIGRGGRTGDGRRADPLSLGATAFFLVAVAAAAYPAVLAGPSTGPGLLLLVGLAGVALAGVFVFGIREREAAAAPA